MGPERLLEPTQQMLGRSMCAPACATSAVSHQGIRSMGES